MAQNLQGRIQLLGILVAAFILLSLPLFAQVRADAAASQERGNDTLLGRFFRDMFQEWNGDANDLEVEDAWGKWQKENDPDCTGAQCGPDGDLDGDGMTNEEEVKRGRNPECDEGKMGDAYCRGQNTPTPTGSPTPTPSPTFVPKLNDLLYETERQVKANAPSSDTKAVAKVSPDYDYWRVEWDIRAYTGTGRYTISIVNASQPSQSYMSESYDLTDVMGDRPGNAYELRGASRPPSGQNYQFQISSDGIDGTWHMKVFGIRQQRVA